MTIDLVCDYCHRSDKEDLFMITLTGIKNTKNTCYRIPAPMFYAPTFSMYCGKCGFVTQHKVFG